MSLSGRSYSQRDYIDMYDERLEMYNACNGICEVCREYVSMNEFEIAHRIPNSPTWRKKYGNEIIDHKLNKTVTHKECNAAVLVVNKPVAREELVSRILRAIDKEDIGNDR